MARHLFLSILLLFIIEFPHSQNRYTDPKYITAYKYAERLYNSPNATDQTDSLALASYLSVISLLENGSGNDSILFDSYLKSGILEMSTKKDQSALQLFLQSIRTKKKSAGLPDSLLFKPYLFAGNSYYNLNDLDSSLYYYRLAENLIGRYPALSESERLYNKSGVLYYETGDYKKSITYFNKALSLVESHQPANIYFIVNYKNNIASALRKLGDYEQAMSIYKSLLPYHINQNELLHNIGVTNLNAGNYADAIHYLKLVTYNNRVKYNDIALAYLQSGQSDSALAYLHAALNERSNIKTKQKDLDYGISLKYTGDWLMANREFLAAIKNYQQAIIQIDPDFNDSVVEHNPVSFHGLHNSFFLFDALVAKAKAFHALYIDHPNRDVLVDAYATYSSAILLVQYVEKTFNSDEAKLFLANNVSKAYKESVDLGLQLFDLSKNKIYLQQAFNFAEESKASILQESLHELSLESIEGIPQNLISEEKNVKAAIAKLNIQLSQKNDNTAASSIRKKMLDMEIQLSSSQAKLDESPKYQELKFNSRHIPIDSIQQNILSDDGAILSYYYLQDFLICFYITKEEFGYKKIHISNDLQKNIASLRDDLNEANNHRKKNIQGTTTYLAGQILYPVFDKIVNKTHLIIIPHNEISYIPFEILPQPGNAALLLKKFSVSYNYSVSFLTGKQQPISKEYEVLALAPFTEQTIGSMLPVLNASKSEVASLKGKILFDNEATKQKFIQLSPGYPILHLATHAVANDKDPLQSYIEFYGSKNDADTLHRLYEQEIYHLDMQSARLVILSACETGNGQLVTGEGIMSLSRAFSYAGCKSVITSLWKADDVATAFITKRLHAYLQKGFRKDDALRQAKSDYLESDDVDASHKSPAYWAHLILIGDAYAINKKNNSLYWIIGGLLFFLLAIIIIIIKKPGRKKYTRAGIIVY